MALASYFKSDGIKSVMDGDRRLQTRTEEFKRIEADNAALRQQIRSVEENSYLMEKFAREKLYLAKRNEVVFRFKDEPER
ncbi:MAG: septum formation initiator family protein [Nitrospinae bacterium]|nr:septum formation initiator family protein [Nitrospinota bacterium]